MKFAFCAKRPDLLWKAATVGLCVIGILATQGGAMDKLSLAPIFLYLFYLQDGPAALLAAAVVAIACFVIDGHGKIAWLFRRVAANPWPVGVAVFVVTALGSHFVYHLHPLSMDEYSAVIQSQIFAAGRLGGEWPPELIDALVPKGFQGNFLIVSRETGAFASAYWPGLPLVMTPFALAGVPWVCNPVVTALTVPVLAAVLDEVLEDPVAKGFGLLAFASSPVILVNGMSFYGMPLQMFCCVLFTLGLLRGSRKWLVVAGVAASLGATTVNPVPFALYALPWLIWVVARAERPWHTIAWLALGGGALSLLFGVGWRLFLLGMEHDPSVGQFGEKIGAMLGLFRLPSREILLARELALLKIFFWSVPVLPAMAVIALFHRHPAKHAAIFMASAVVTLVGFLFVPLDQGHGWGFRYFHATWFVLPILAASALQNAGIEEASRPRAIGFVGAACIGTLLLSMPLRSVMVAWFIDTHLQQIPPRVDAQARQAVFIRVNCGFYAADLIQNHPFLQSNEIRMVSNGRDSDLAVVSLLGRHPRLVREGKCGDRWLLD